MARKLLPDPARTVPGVRRGAVPHPDLLWGLVVLGAAALLTFWLPAVTGSWRVALAFIALLYVPGYAATCALFPNRSDIDPVSRAALTFGLSVAAVPLLATPLSALPWGISGTSMVAALWLLSALLSGVAVWRRQRSAVQEPPRFRQSVYARGLGLAMLAALGGVVLVGGLTSRLRAQQSYTEFYALGQTGRLERYPRPAAAGAPFELTLGITNAERFSATYSIRAPGCSRAVVPLLAPGQVWQGRLRCRVARPGAALNAELYLGGTPTPYRTLTLRWPTP